MALVLAPLLGGLVKGLAGFGFSLIGISILTSFFQPSKAVTLFIIPILAVQIELLNELSLNDFKACSKRFSLYIVPGIIGTLIGILLLRTLPGWPIKMSIGLITLIYGLNRTRWFEMKNEITLPLNVSQKVYEPILGALSGIIFGSTSIGIQFVAYLKSLELDQRKYLGVLAMIMLGISGLRIAISWQIGLYPNFNSVKMSLGIAALGVTSVFLFTRLGYRIPDKYTETAATTFLTFIGVYLLVSSIISM